MKLNDFINKKNILEKLLCLLKVYREERLYYEFNINPDCSNYRANEERLCYSDVVDFGYIFDDIVCVDLKYIYGVDSSVVTEIKDRFGIEEVQSEWILNSARDDYRHELSKDEEYLSDFKVENFRAIIVHDNKVDFSCNFISSVNVVNNPDSHFFLDIELCGLDTSFDELPIYKQALCESYKLMYEGKYKLSFFMAYVSFDGFVNFHHGSSQEEKRLSEKFSELFLKNSPGGMLQKHQLYTMICGKINGFDAIRNGIAHGDIRGQHITLENCKEIVMYVSMAICSFEFKLDKLVDLNAEIKSI